MGKTDPRVDQYIAKSADFAKPILTHIRKVVHAACPDVEETMKWSSPHFDYKGMMCGMAAFKGHCAFGFWKSSLVLDEPAGDDEHGTLRQDHIGQAICHRIAARRLRQESRKLNDDGVKVARKAGGAEEAADACRQILPRRSRRSPPRGRPSTPSARVTSRIRRVGDRSQDRRHTSEADGDGGRVAVRRQDPQLEVRAEMRSVARPA